MVRVVAAPDDAVLADERRQRGQRVLVDLEADGALPGEVLRRAQRHVGAEAAEGLGLLVEALEPEGRPATGGLQEEQAQARVALQRPEGDQLGTGEHLLEGVRDGMEDERVEGAVRPQGRDVDRAALVDADGHAELLGRLPHHVVGPVGQRAARGTGWGGRIPATRPSSVTARRSSWAAAARVLQRDHGRAEEPARVGGAVAGQPVVVGGGQGHRGGRVRHAARSTARWSGTARPGRCPRCPCRAAGPPGRTRPAGRRPAGGTTPGRRRSSPGGPACPAAPPGSRCRPRRRARSRRGRR